MNDFRPCPVWHFPLALGWFGNRGKCNYSSPYSLSFVVKLYIVAALRLFTYTIVFIFFSNCIPTIRIKDSIELYLTIQKAHGTRGPEGDTRVILSPQNIEINTKTFKLFSSLP